MFFNFKNKNMIIILLLLIVLGSVFCYSLMMKSVEGNTNLGTSYFTDNFKINKKDYANGIDYYVLDSKNDSKEVTFEQETSLSVLESPILVNKEDVGYDIYKYMYDNQYDMYRIVTKTETPPATEITPLPTPITTESYEFYKITVPFSINIPNSTTIPAPEATPPPESPAPESPAPESPAPETPEAISNEQQANDALATLENQIQATPMSTLTTTFSMQGSGLTTETIINLKNIISQQASIVDPNGTKSVAIAPSQVTITEVPQAEGANSLLKIDTSVPSANKDTIIAQLTIFSSVQSFNRELRTGGITSADLHIVNKMIDLNIVEGFMNFEGFGNMENIFSKLLGKKVKEGNTNMASSSSSGNILIGIKNNDYTKILSRTGSVMNITISISDINGQKNIIVQDGTLKVLPPSQVVTPPNPTTQEDTNLAGSIASGGSVSIGDINMPRTGPGGIIYPQYLLPGSDPTLLNKYNAPFYGEYTSFETAMNNPSNPLVNPINSMNPIEYSQTLFGPWTTPMMTKTACLNCDDDKEKVNNKNDDVLDNSKNIFNDINSRANTMMAQNGEVDENEDSNVRMNVKSGKNNNYSEYGNSSNNNQGNGSQPPCPPCGRCPDTSNFECKKVPNYEMGLNNSALPRPVLSNFSTFGS